MCFLFVIFYLKVTTEDTFLLLRKKRGRGHFLTLNRALLCLSQNLAQLVPASPCLCVLIDMH